MPTVSSGSGTGVFPSFLKLASNNNNVPNTTVGYNSDTINKNEVTQDANNSSQHTHSLLLADIPTVTINNRDFIEVLMDANEPNGGDPYLAINELRFYSHEDPNLNTYSDANETLGGLGAVWDMDDIFDHDLLIDYSNYAGSGNPDLVLLVDKSLFTGTYVSLFMRAGIEYADNQGDHESGFEEWGITGDGTPYTVTPPKAVPLPASAWLFGSALLGFIGMRRRKAANQHS